MSLKRPLVTILSVCLLGLAPALAQGVRSLGMGGAVAPGSAESRNPAYAALPGDGTSIPLPLGAISAFTSDRLDPNGDSFDLLTAFDQATHLGTFILNPVESPDEVTVSIGRNDAGELVATIGTEGGATLQATQGVPIGYGQRLELPVNFPVGPVRLGLRPYVHASGTVTPGDDFADLFGEGTGSGSLDVVGEAEAGVAVDVVWAGAVPLPASDPYPGDVYIGVRAAPFVGLARIDATGSLSVGTESTGGDDELDVEYEAEGFVSTVADGGLGYGLRGDLGFVTSVPTDEGTLTAGLGLSNLGVAFWDGEAYDVSDEDDDADPTPASRTYVAEGFGVTATAAYDFDPAALGMEELSSLLVATDVGYADGLVSGHLGAEAGFGVEIGELLARAGVGYDAGLVYGVGAGLRLSGVGFDLALHGHRSPFTTHQAIGVSAGVAFGF